jgi:hypothetical protein
VRTASYPDATVASSYCREICRGVLHPALASPKILVTAGSSTVAYCTQPNFLSSQPECWPIYLHPAQSFYRPNAIILECQLPDQLRTLTCIKRLAKSLISAALRLYSVLMLLAVSSRTSDVSSPFLHGFPFASLKYNGSEKGKAVPMLN